jgi:CubicO group peptidase (beta-lactamase class C family)
MPGGDPLIKRALLIAFLILPAACSSNARTPAGPAGSWPVSSPEAQELDPARLDKILQEIASGAYGYVDRILLIRNGYAVLDQDFEHDYGLINAGRDPTPDPYNYYDPNWHPYLHGSDLHTLQSVTKSVTAIVVGIAILRGELPDTSVPVFDYFADYEIKHFDQRKQRMTLEDLLTMRSGLEWDEWTYPVGDPRNSVTQLESSEDWIQFVLDLPMAYEPGEVFVYNSGASQLLSVVVNQATGLPIDEYAEKYLFQPMGIHDYYWKKTPEGWPDTEGGLYLKAEDLAKIGYLVLNEGTWEGRRVVAKEWVDEMTDPKVADVSPQDPGWNDAYGLQWWLLGDQASGEPKVDGALGYGGQFLFVVPELDMIAVFYGWNIYGTRSSLVRDLFIEQILPAVDPN